MSNLYSSPLSTAQIGSTPVGSTHPLYITFEAGPTHTGLASAMRLVDVAATAGVNGIKFQLFDPDKLIADKSLEFSYQVLDEDGNLRPLTSNLYDLFVSRSLSSKDWSTLAKHILASGLDFICTAGSPDEVDFLLDLGCTSIKVASSDLTYVQLLEHISTKNVNVQVDTGSGDITEISSAIQAIILNGNNNLIIHHCPTGYPATPDNVHLSMIRSLIHLFPTIPIAFSDHSPGIHMDIAAVSLGASMIEKTITESRTTQSVEHAFSLEPSEAPNFVSSLRDLQRAFGNGSRVLSSSQLSVRSDNRRGAYSRRSMTKGELLTVADIAFKRPQKGMTPIEAANALPRVLNTDILADTPIYPQVLG